MLHANRKPDEPQPKASGRIRGLPPPGRLWRNGERLTRCRGRKRPPRLETGKECVPILSGLTAL